MYNRYGVWQSPSTTQAVDNALFKTADSGLQRPEPGNASQYLCVPLDMIPLDTALPCALYVRISEKFVLFRKVGDILTAVRAQALAVPSNGVIFVSLAEWSTLLNSLEAIAVAADMVAEPQQVKALRIRNLLIAYSHQAALNKEYDRALFARIRMLGDELATLLYAKPELCAEMLKRFQDPLLYHVNHVVNVAIYGIAVGKKQNLELAATKHLATAALLHNVGNVKVPANLLFKRGELSVEEKNTVDTHNLHGANLLAELGADREVVLTALQHHDRFDGQGTVGRGSGTEIHLFARICSIADVFDAITSHRPYHMRPLQPAAAVRRMTDMKGKFDPHILPTVVGAGVKS